MRRKFGHEEFAGIRPPHSPSTPHCHGVHTMAFSTSIVAGSITAQPVAARHSRATEWSVQSGSGSTLGVAVTTGPLTVLPSLRVAVTVKVWATPASSGSMRRRLSLVVNRCPVGATSTVKLTPSVSVPSPPVDQRSSTPRMRAVAVTLRSNESRMNVPSTSHQPGPAEAPSGRSRANCPAGGRHLFVPFQTTTFVTTPVASSMTAHRSFSDAQSSSTGSEEWGTSGHICASATSGAASTTRLSENAARSDTPRPWPLRRAYERFPIIEPLFRIGRCPLATTQRAISLRRRLHRPGLPRLSRAPYPPDSDGDPVRRRVPGGIA